MNDTGGEKSCLNRESNPGSLAYRAITLTTELSRHTEQTTNFSLFNLYWIEECPDHQVYIVCTKILYDRENYTQNGTLSETPDPRRIRE